MVLVNPPARHLGRDHVILNGVACDHHVRDFPGPLSIKSVIRGTATWQTTEGRFEIGPGSCVLINDRQPYSITVESRTPVETLCMFFARGFVEDVHRAMTTTDEQLLDQPASQASIDFPERVRHNDSHLIGYLTHVRDSADRDAGVIALGAALVRSRTDALRAASRIPAARPATRGELIRRVHRARNVIEGSLAESVSLEKIAREAALSAYHLHRTFTRVFGETPHEYMTRRRVERATELLKSTDMPVTNICFACGFQSLGSFSTLFRQKTGVSPSRLRK